MSTLLCWMRLRGFVRTVLEVSVVLTICPLAVIRTPEHDPGTCLGQGPIPLYRSTHKFKSAADTITMNYVVMQHQYISNSCRV